jgi:hypothetical protein
MTSHISYNNKHQTYPLSVETRERPTVAFKANVKFIQSRAEERLKSMTLPQKCGPGTALFQAKKHPPRLCFQLPYGVP